MASLVATAGAPLLVAPIQRLIEKASDATIGVFWEEIKLIRGVKREKERLVSMMEKINMVLAEKNHTERGLVQNWLDQLSELVYDAEDVLDELATEDKLMARRKKCFLLELVCKLRSKHYFSRQLKSIWIKLDAIKNDYKESGIKMRTTISIERKQTQQDSNSGHQPRQITSGFTPLMEKLVPRPEEQRKIMNWLFDIVEEARFEARNGGDMNVSFFSVTGMGGIGKTTLAQSVYSDSRVEKSFQARMWVCVSNDFNITRITKDMMASLDYTGDSGYHNFENLDALQRRLEHMLEGKRILLVLDDVHDLKHNWNTILNPLRGAKKESKVLVTTRNNQIVDTLKCGKNMLHLKGLSDDDVSSILKSKAFSNKNIDDVKGRWCDEISKKLGGSPLAAKAVGSLLNDKFDQEYWKSVAESNQIGILQEKDQDGIISVLRLTYDRLPPHLKECFAYCSVFPKGYKFERQETILSWMAQGLVKPGDGEPSVEWWGNKHFDDLLSVCLFEQYENAFWGFRDIYVMHDLIHDLAASVSKDCSATIKHGQGKISGKLRHLTLLVDPTTHLLGSNFVDVLSNCQRLRTLHLENHVIMSQQRPPSIIYLDRFLGKGVCKKLKRLRCLRLVKCPVRKFPASISNLKHLRFLYLERLDVQELPESLGDLCNLQVLAILDCFELNRLPKKLGSLTNLRHLTIREAVNLVEELPGSLCELRNLRHLDLSGTYLLGYLPEDVSKLSNLQALILAGCRSLKKLPDRIGHLTNLKILDVRGCMDLQELPESLGDAHNLQELNLEFSRPTKLPGSINQLANLSHIHTFDDGMLHGIAHPGGMTALQQLCTGANPRELKHMNELRRLRLGSLHLVTSEEAREAALHRKTHLTSLELCFDRIYPYDRPTPRSPKKYADHDDEGVLEGLQPYLAGIQQLDISHYRGVRLPRWKTADDQQLQQQPRPIIFTCLRLLQVSDCPMLKRLPPLPPTLQRLLIWNCPMAEWAPPSSSSSLFTDNDPPAPGGKPFAGHLFLSSSLVNLTVGVFSEPSNDDDAQLVSELLGYLPSLQRLTIQRFIKNTIVRLSPPGEEHLQPLASPLYMEIRNCPLLTSFPLLAAYISNREPAKSTARDDIPYNTTTASAASSSSISPSSFSSPHQKHKQMPMEELRFDGIPTEMINKLLRGTAPFMQPRRLEFCSCDELTFLGDDKLEEALLALVPSLSYLKFSNCANLGRLPPWLSCLSSLDVLDIESC